MGHLIKTCYTTKKDGCYVTSHSATNCSQKQSWEKPQYQYHTSLSASLRMLASPAYLPTLPPQACFSNTANNFPPHHPYINLPLLRSPVFNCSSPSLQTTGHHTSTQPNALLNLALPHFPQMGSKHCLRQLTL